VSGPPKISVCILAGHGHALLDACLGSLAAQQSAPEFELLIGGMLNDESVAIVHGYFPSAGLLETMGRLPGAARNPLVEEAQGELLLFLDDDVVVPVDLLANLAAVADQHPSVSVFGGPNDTPPWSTRFQVVQGAVMSSLVGAGPVSRRYGARAAGPADERWFTLCNLAVRRSRMVPFLASLVCAEENALLAQLRARDEPMLYEPSLRVFHARRRTSAAFARQMLKYGRGRGQLLARSPGTFRLAYIAPSTLLVNFVMAAILLLACVDPGLALGPTALYGGLVMTSAGRVGWTLRSPSAVPIAGALTVLIHLCYGIGVIRGVLRPGREPAVAASGVTDGPSVPDVSRTASRQPVTARDRWS